MKETRAGLYTLFNFEDRVLSQIGHLVTATVTGPEGEEVKLNLSPLAGPDMDQDHSKLKAILKKAGPAETPKLIAMMRQCHGSNIGLVRAGESTACSAFPPSDILMMDQFDGLITDQPNVVLMGLCADCPLVLLTDPARGVTGIAHSGWKGTFLDIAGNLARNMILFHSCRPEDMAAGIGPCISADSFAVGEQVAEKLFSLALLNHDEVAERSILLGDGKNEPFRIDLAELITLQLNRMGIQRVEKSGLCTLKEEKYFHSYRRDGYSSGRFAMLAWMNP